MVEDNLVSQQQLLLSQQQLLRQTLDEVRNRLEAGSLPQTTLAKEFPFRSRYQHTVRVCQWAKRLLEQEPGDAFVVLLAAALHDVGYGMGRENHALEGAAFCRDYLTGLFLPAETVERVAHLVTHHSSKHLPVDELPIELQILMDADILDEIGALAVTWDFLDEGALPKQSYFTAHDRLIKSLSHIERHAAEVKTATGKRLFEERVAFLRRFIVEMEYEMAYQEPVF